MLIEGNFHFIKALIRFNFQHCLFGQLYAVFFIYSLLLYLSMPLVELLIINRYLYYIDFVDADKNEFSGNVEI